MPREIHTTYVYACDSPPACGEVLRVAKGASDVPDGIGFRAVETAADADQVAHRRGWYFRGGKAICPRHVMAGGL